MILNDDRAFSPSLALLGGFILLSVIYTVGKNLYAVFYGPLSHVPGPKSSALSRVPYIRHLLRGSTIPYVESLHERYGDVVRISPNQVSFTSIDTAFPDIYGFRTGKHKGRPNMAKDPVWYPTPVNGVQSLLKDTDEDHAKGRRLLSHAFSEKALAGQEHLIQQYVDQLIDRLKEVTAEHPSQDMAKWMNWTTFDVITDLLFGEPFGSLQDLSTHKYITLLFDALTASRMYYVLTYFPFVRYLGSLIIDKTTIASRIEFFGWVHDQVQRRCERDTQRPDFMTHILEHNGEKEAAMTDKQLDSNAHLLLIAGSETTATLLSGAIYCLLTNPDKLKKLRQEVRGSWKDYSEITIAEVNSAPYLLAVLSEALRYFPPVPVGFERRVGKGGDEVSGYFIPEGTAVSVSHYTAYHSAKNFKNPNAFVPERWMGDPEYADDKRAFCQPFSFGPRNCLGKNLAYAEMRLVLAKLVWSFDMQLDPSCRDWMSRCKVMTLWNKPPLMVHVKAVAR